MIAGLSALCVLISSDNSGAFADEADEMATIAKYRGEELLYSLEFLGAETAHGMIVVGDFEETEDGIRMPIAGLAETTGLAALIYPMHDADTTYVDVHTGLPISKVLELDEQGEERTYDVTYNHERYVTNVTRVRDGTRRRYQRYLPSNTHDGISWIFTVRQQDQTPGTTHIYFVYDGWKLSRLHVTVQDETDEIMIGDEFVECRRMGLYREVMTPRRPLPFIQETAALPPVMWVRETNSGEQVGELWISEDERRLPAQIVFHNDIMSATARLASYRPPTDGY